MIWPLRGPYSKVPMKFNYELKINNREAFLKMVAPSMSSVLESFSFNGLQQDVESVKKKVDWTGSVSSVIDRLNQIHFCQIISSSEEGDPPKPEYTASYSASWGSNSSKKKKEKDPEVSEEAEESED